MKHTVFEHLNILFYELPFIHFAHFLSDFMCFLYLYIFDPFIIYYLYFLLAVLWSFNFAVITVPIHQFKVLGA